MLYTFEDFQLDTDRYELRCAGRDIKLEPQVFDVLALLVENHDRAVTKQELLDRVWPGGFVTEAVLTSRLMAARKAIGDNGREQRLIRTLHGRGYRFVGNVRESSRKAAPTPSGAEGSLEQQVRFCTTSDGVQIAYAATGAGPPLVKVANWLSHLEYDWRSPIWRHWVEELSHDHTLVRYDERGCGLSDRNPAGFSFEGWLYDLEAVVDTLGLDRFPLLGISQGGPVAIAYTARHPDRVTHLVLYGTYARGRNHRDATPGQLEERQALITLTKHGWGRDDPTYRQLFTSGFVPGATPEQMRWFNDIQRASVSGENAARFMEAFDSIDVREFTPKLDVPTLVLHCRDERRVPFEEGRRLAATIPGARFVTLEGSNHILLEQDAAWLAFLAEVRHFLGRPADGLEKLAGATAAAPVVTILFTDIESSTSLTQRFGDAAAHEMVRVHNTIVRNALRDHAGTEVKHTGDGMMASFPSASRALEAAVEIQRAVSEYRGEPPLRVRIGLNAGEPLVEDGDLYGTSVQLARRICDYGSPDQILVPDVVRQLAAGKGFAFHGAGTPILKGFEEAITLYELQWKH